MRSRWGGDVRSLFFLNAANLAPLLDGTRRVGLLGFPEHFNSRYLELRQQ